MRISNGAAALCLSFAALAVAFGATGFFADRALSAPGPSTLAPTGAPSALPTTRASAAASAAAPPAKPTLDGAALPTTSSAPPAEADWASAPEVGASRGALSPDCKAKLVREWLRVTCARSPGVGLVAGDPALVRLRSSFQESPLEMKSVADIAVRRGASTIVSFVSASIGTTSVTAAEGQLVQVGWRDAEPHPLLVAYPTRPAR